MKTFVLPTEKDSEKVFPSWANNHEGYVIFMAKSCSSFYVLCDFYNSGDPKTIAFASQTHTVDPFMRGHHRIFYCDTRADCIRAALQAGHEVLWFPTKAEMYQFVADNIKG